MEAFVGILTGMTRTSDIEANTSPANRQGGPAQQAADAGERARRRHGTASPFLSNDEAADFLRLSPRTLEKYRVAGGGPRFRKFGRRVFYSLVDLEEWAERRVCVSTSDPAWGR